MWNYSAKDNSNDHTDKTKVLKCTSIKTTIWVINGVLSLIIVLNYSICPPHFGSIVAYI